MRAPFARGPLPRLVAAGALAAFASCSPATPPPAPAPAPVLADAAAPTPPGRHGTHGMIAFGQGSATYLAHIPMFRPPHDAQLVLEVAPSGGAARDLGAELHTFEPKPASLDDIIARRTQRLEGTLFRGNMEQGGQPVDEQAAFEVRRVVYVRDPLRAGDPAPADLEYVLVGKRDHAYLVHVVRRAPDFDQLLRVTVREGNVDDADLARGISLMATGKKNDEKNRAGAGTELALSAPGKTVKVNVERELSCLSGPEFDKACAPAADRVATFDDDVAFLNGHGSVVVLASPDGGRVALSAKYQGRVMTSAVAHDAPSLGFVFRKFIEAGKTGTQFDNYGGEDRFWLGPEAGPFGLYFPPGKPFKIDHWQTPAALQEGEWAVASKSDAHVTFRRDMKVANYAGATFELAVERTVRLLASADAQRVLGVEAGAWPKRWIGFEVTNKVTNIGKRAWTKDKGLLSIWILGMYNPAGDMTVIVPFDKSAKGDLVNDRYFGKVPADRLAVRDDHLLFKCDGQHRSKIGLGPARARSVLGSYSASRALLTIVHYDKPAPRAGAPGGVNAYVNSMWEAQADPFAGDVVNSYNDGPTEPGKPSLGGFYELETSSPALALAPGASAIHTQRTLHFAGSPADLEPLARKALGVGLPR
jgi:hypothetical protein